MWKLKMPFAARAINQSAENAPFAKGRRVWDEWIGDALLREKRAYWIAAGCLALTGFALYDNQVERSKRQFRVLVVERDANGNVVGSSNPAETRPLSDAQIAQRFKTWVFNARSVLVDATALRTILVNAYATTKAGSAAEQRLKQFHIAEDPREAATRYTRYVYRQTALKQANNTWQVDWCESKTDRDGQPISIEAWRMVATYTIEPPTPRSAADNPDGWYTLDFDWRRVIDGPTAARLPRNDPMAVQAGAVPQACS